MSTRWFKNIAALLTAVLMTVLPMGSVFSGSLASAEGERVLEPRISDGAQLVSGPEERTIACHESGNALVFDETRLLSFTVAYDEGWSASVNYSVFFPGDARASSSVNDDGSVTFTFDAREGESVLLESWESTAVNAAAAALPQLCIDTEIPFEDIGRDEWVDASFSLKLGSKQFESGNFEGVGSVKGRGNSSWGYPKKPYSIKLDKKASLLDIPKTKKYAIIPSYYDGSLMRNYITYKAYQDLEGIGYVTKCEFVDVYLNGIYNGIYILVERIDIETSKINIEEATADNITGGYLIEKDLNGRVDFSEDLWFNCPYWANQTKDYFVCKAPEPDDPELWAQMRAYLENYVQLLHDSVMNGEGEPYTHYVDTSSWVDFIIVQEIAKNIDGNMKTSCWMYKEADDDHLYMTAPWDFDFAYGRVTWTNASEEHNDYYDCPPAHTPDGFMILNSSNPWMDHLYDNEPAFRSALKERYAAYRHTVIDNLFTLINEQAAYLSIVQEGNHDLWPATGSFATGVSRLRSWLTDRLEWLDGEWLTDDEPAIDLDEALNVEGGELHFGVEDEGSPFIGAEIDGTKLALAEGAGEHGFSLEHEFSESDSVSFDYCIEGADAVLTLLIDGEEALTVCASECIPERELNMQTAIAAVDGPGAHTLRWVFTCGEDGRAYIDNVRIGPRYIMGDVDMNGVIDSTDALLALRFALGIIDDPMIVQLSDVNGDGALTTEDSLIILRMALGIIR